MALTLRRKRKQSIRIGENIRITIADIIGSNQVSVSIEAPTGVTILREELIEKAGGILPREEE